MKDKKAEGLFHFYKIPPSTGSTKECGSWNVSSDHQRGSKKHVNGAVAAGEKGGPISEYI